MYTGRTKVGTKPGRKASDASFADACGTTGGRLVPLAFGLAAARVASDWFLKGNEAAPPCL